MATTLTQAKPPIEPAFKRVQQSDDFNCWLACIATIVGKPLEEVRAVAVKEFGLPAHGPYWPSDTLIAKLFAYWNFVSSVYKEVSSLTHLPGVCILLVEYDPETEIGRHVVFVRDKRQKPVIEYVIDPAYWIEESQYVRTDIKNLKPAWYISIHPMNAPVAGGQAAREDPSR
ncbi:hypothetical protein EGT07_07780 [Herbaspirillum sp. HC18]|nr:hypothetical protein EGT07_07780 [Herbaspirillum sp. HC18]